MELASISIKPLLFPPMDMKEKWEIDLYIYLKCLYPVDFPLTTSSREDKIQATD